MADQEQSFREFVYGSQRRLVNFAEFLVGDRGRAEDLVQEAYVTAFARWSRIKDRAPEAYVRRCIINGRTDWWRRRSSSERTTPPELMVETTSAVDATAEVDQRLLVLSALERLTGRERTVIVLRYYLGQTEFEIANELGLAPGTVKSTAARAVAKLRRDPLLWEGDLRGTAR